MKDRLKKQNDKWVQVRVVIGNVTMVKYVKWEKNKDV